MLLLAALAVLGLGSERSAGTRRVLALVVVLLGVLWTTWRRQLLL